MTTACVHGVPTQQCASCRTCAHGNVTSRCGRCSNVLASRAAAKRLPDEQPPIDHRGHRIFFVPADRSWYYREGADGPISQLSFRSAFQARRAVDEAIDNPPAVPAAPTKKKR